MKPNLLHPGIFQPTPPARTETVGNSEPVVQLSISTHSAREDGDNIDKKERLITDISTHSAREDGDSDFCNVILGCF